MVLFTENRGVIVTIDEKCIVRGHSKYGMTLCTLEETSKLKVKMFRSVKDIENFIDLRYLKITPAVAELYHVEGDRYDILKIPELRGVKVVGTYEFYSGGKHANNRSK